jgi:predicted alpha-1,2-mannosidase
MKKMKHLFLFLLLPVALFAQKQPVDYVNPFIGTGGHGHTFPGATVPFGMVQLSPDTRTAGWDAAGGYHYSDSTILGFSHTHLNGTGVNDLCDILMTPSVSPTCKPLHFRHEDEVAKAGYYKTILDKDGIEAELTATERVDFQRLRFDKGIKTIYIFISLSKRNELLESRFFVKDKDEIEGTMVSKSWAKERHLSFTAQFSLDILKMEKGMKYKDTVVDRSTIMLSFDVSKTHELLIKVGLSPVSEENAAKNMQAELPNWDFEKVRKEATEKWAKYLNRIQIEGGTDDQRTIFYTALYHTLIHPSLSQDVNGDYRGLDNKVYNSRKFQYHSIFSLWDTYRALHPLYTILCPEKIPDFVNGFLDDFDKTGHLPVWNFSGNETWCMIGNHSIPVIADAYLKGIKGFDAEHALNAMIKTVNRDTFGLKAYREKGYIPADTEGESVSKTLEYAYDDYCIAMMAKALNHDDIYKTYIQRSQNWKNIFNPKTGFFQAKINETFVEPFDPREVNVHFTEGNAWQYAFAVQHDIEGLIQMLGGNDKFEAKLDTFFNNESKTTGREQVDITGLIGQYAQGNEPSHHIAYLYNYVGKPAKTQRLVRQIMDNFYKNAPDGLIGNEDCGQMSAWYVMSAMGFYAINPCGGEYQIGSPIFSDVAIFDKTKIKTYRNSAENIYIKSKDRTFGDNVHSNVNDLFLQHVNLTNGGCDEFTMDNKPSETHFYTHLGKTEFIDLPIIPIPFISKGKKLFKEKQQIELSCADKNAEIYYTTDGSNPMISGVKYTEPIEITEAKTIKFEARLNGEHSKTAVASFKKIDKTATIVLKNQPSPQYAGGATDALVDGERGTEQWQLGGWQGFEGVDLEAVIDLKEERTFSRIIVRCMEDQNAWIFPPSEIRFFTSSDGQNFTEISVETPLLKPNTEGAHIRLLGNRVKGKARYIKVVAKPLNPIPAWHKGAGGKGWIFADEIEVN